MAEEISRVNQLLHHLFRHESGKMVAVLTRLLGFQNLETAQDIVQETLLQALHNWRFHTVPDNPSAWLYRVAKNKALDYIRRERNFKDKVNPQYAQRLQSEYTLSPALDVLFTEHEIADSQLRMIFACCHPAIPEEAQVALTLKTLCGLSTEEIARAFLTQTDTITKRIYRAKEKIREQNIEPAVPQGAALTNRLDTVLKCLYLLFNEGYNSSHPEQLIRDELCEDALRLCHLLAIHPHTQMPKTKALLALLSFQASRLGARQEKKGQIILLKDQDRRQWNTDLIRQGFYWIEAAATGSEISVYHLEAGIASLHASAPSFEKTDWKSIYHLYEILYSLQPGPVVALNKAIASAYANSTTRGLEELLAIKGLENYHLWYATAGEFFLETNDKEKARLSFEKALSLTPSRTEKQLLFEKLARCN